MNTGNAASLELVVFHHAVRLGGKHCLNVVLTIAHDETIPISSLGSWGHRFDLKTLQNRDREQLGRLVGVVEDDTGNALLANEQFSRDWTSHTRGILGITQPMRPF